LVAATTRTSTFTVRLAPTGRTSPFLQDAQQLHLERGRRFADFIQENRAALRLLEQSPRVVDGAGERAAGVAKQLRLQKRLGQRATVDRHERPGRAAAVAMDGPRDQLLAGAAAADDQHGRLRAAAWAICL
jgi:hypothetical protein